MRVNALQCNTQTQRMLKKKKRIILKLKYSDCFFLVFFVKELSLIS